MKKRNILITYVNQNDVISIGKRERAFKSVMQELTDKGLKLVEMNKDSQGQKAKFNDGSFILMVSFGIISRGNRFTHLYLDEEALDFPNGEQYISQILLPQLISSGESSMYSEYDVISPSEKRIKLFSIDSQNKVNFKDFSKK